MENNNEKNPGEELLQAVYKNAKMGKETLTTVIGKTKNEKVRAELTSQLESYHGFESEARNKLMQMSQNPKEPSVMAKLPADISIKMSTLMDSSDSKIAEIMIDGYNMGIIELQKSLNQAKNSGVGEDIIGVANNVIAFEEGSIEKMKTFL